MDRLAVGVGGDDAEGRARFESTTVRVAAAAFGIARRTAKVAVARPTVTALERPHQHFKGASEPDHGREDDKGFATAGDIC
jgi:hypothetical protein